jgi:hypothetical protein
VPKECVELLNKYGNPNEDAIDCSYVLIANSVFKGERTRRKATSMLPQR